MHTGSQNPPVPNHSGDATISVSSVPLRGRRDGGPLWTALGEQPGEGDEMVISVTPSHHYQRIDGCGGSFSELGYRAISALSEAEQERVFNALFGSPDAQDGGADLTTCRVPIGASDFAFEAYSLNDHDGDLEMAHFSLERDEGALLPYIRGARKANPELWLHASPWSPPAWMKTNGRMDDGGSLRDEPEILRAYAEYLVRFVESYTAAGAPVRRLVVQNEPDSPAPFPGCVMPPEQMSRFVRDYLAPLLRERCDSELWAGTFRTITSLYSHELARDRAFLEAVDGFGFQYSFPRYLADFARLAPDVPIMHTESACYNGENSPEQAASLFYDVIHYLAAGCSLFTYWNMILGGEAKSSWGWKQNSLVHIDEARGSVSYQPDYEVMRLVSPVLNAAARRVESFCRKRETIALADGAGGFDILVGNLEDRATPVTIEHGGTTFAAELPASAVCVISYKEK
ncbi:MAG: glycoside hydrolase family 30 protein [Spirochaetales bacterium]